jgi:hypothetical protein
MKRADFRSELEQAAREQAIFAEKALDAITLAAETSVTEVLHKVHTRKKHIWALNRVLDLYAGIEDRVNQRLRYAERFARTPTATLEPETQQLMAEPATEVSEPRSKAVA